MDRPINAAPAKRRVRKTSSAGRKRLSELAQSHAKDAMAALVEIACEGSSEAARISAANSILDRAFGKPASGQQGDEDEAQAKGGVKLSGALSDHDLARIAVGTATGGKNASSSGAA